MKTPRQLLLDRHQTAQARLDEVRRAALSEMLGREGNPAARRTGTQWWLAWLVPGRAGWATLGAAWVLIALLRFAGPSESGHAPAVVAASAEAWMAQRRLMAELMDAPAPPREPAPAPRPRSERRREPLFLSA